MAFSTVHHRSGIANAALVTAWMTAVVLGFYGLLHYAAQPGVLANPGNAWPRGMDLRPAREQATLVVFMHPRCPCSQATVGELERMLSKVARRPETIFLFGYPADEDESWTQGSLWERCGRILGAQCLADRGGSRTDTFGATTSGHCMLFEPGGRLVFSGGITPARAHEGESAGGQALQRVLQTGVPQTGAFLTYGCPLVAGGVQ